jgi:hypothetical protein
MRGVTQSTNGLRGRLVREAVREAVRGGCEGRLVHHVSECS